MFAWETFFDPSAFELLGWVIVHFIWQGAAIAVLYGIAKRFFPRSARARYRLGCIALLIMGATPVITGFYLADKFEDPGALDTPTGWLDPDASVARAAMDGSHALAQPPMTSLRGRIQRVLLPVFVVAVSVWFIGGAIVSVKQLGAWLLLRRWVRTSASLSVEENAHLDTLARKMNLWRTIRFRQSSVVDGPATLGWLRPIIFVPKYAFDRLEAAQLDALVLHELSHVRRHDFIVGILHAAVAGLLFFHPAVQWISREIHDERENCCDDEAVSLSADPLLYATALAKMEKLRCALPLPVLGAHGGSLLQRIRRLGRQRAQISRRRDTQGAVGSILVLGLLVVCGRQLLATSVVRPPRGIDQIQSLSVTVYQILEIPEGDNDFLDSLRQALDSSVNGRPLDDQLVDNLVSSLIGGSRPDAIAQEIVCHIGLDDPRRYQETPSWKYHSSYARRQVVASIYDRAKAMRGTAPERAAVYARAALALAAQESFFSGPGTLASMLQDADLPNLAGLRHDQLLRLRRHVEDHLLVTRLCVAQRLRGQKLLADLRNPPNATVRLTGIADMMQVLTNMISFASERPDVHWQVANLAAQLTSCTGSWDRDKMYASSPVWEKSLRREYFRDWMDGPTPATTMPAYRIRRMSYQEFKRLAIPANQIPGFSAASRPVEGSRPRSP